MEATTMAIIFVSILLTGASTFFVTKGFYNDEHERIQARINNQLIINQEKDNAHEFSQSIFLVILAVVTSFVALYIVGKCTINAILTKKAHQRAISLAVRHTPTVATIAAPNAQEEFAA